MSANETLQRERQIEALKMKIKECQQLLDQLIKVPSDESSYAQESRMLQIQETLKDIQAYRFKILCVEHGMRESDAIFAMKLVVILEQIDKSVLERAELLNKLQLNPNDNLSTMVMNENILDVKKYESEFITILKTLLTNRN